MRVFKMSFASGKGLPASVVLVAAMGAILQNGFQVMDEAVRGKNVRTGAADPQGVGRVR